MVEWIEWARKEGIIRFPSGEWSPGITELNRQLNRFVMKRTSTGYKYEAAEEDDHDDLVMALVILCHYARMRVLELGDEEELPLGMGSPENQLDQPKDQFSRNVLERMQSSGMGSPEIEAAEDW